MNTFRSICNTLNNVFLSVYPIVLIIFILPYGVISLIKLIIHPLLISNITQLNNIRDSDISRVSNINWGITQMTPPDIIINDNTVLVEAEPFPNLDFIKEEYDKKIIKLKLEKKYLIEKNRELQDKLEKVNIQLTNVGKKQN